MYGERCNFIHTKPTCGNCCEHNDSGFQEIKAEVRLQSRLLKLLELN